MRGLRIRIVVIGLLLGALLVIGGAGLLLADAEEFTVNIYTNKDFYIVGEVITVTMEFSADAQATLLDHLADGTTNTIFENRSYKAGTHKLQGVIEPPLGTETIELVATDRHRHRASASVSFQVVDRPSDVSIDRTLIGLNIFIIDDGATTLADGAEFPSDRAVLGEPQSWVPEEMERRGLPTINRIWGQCKLSFEIRTVKVVRPELLQLPDGRTLADIFVLSGGFRHMDIDSTPFSDVLSALDRALRREGEEGIEPDSLSIFIVGSSLIGRDVWAQGFAPLGEKLSVLLWESTRLLSTTIAFRVIAHESGHNFGLLHTGEDGIPEDDNDSLNLMTPNGAGEHLVEAQCEVVHYNLTGLIPPDQRKRLVRIVHPREGQTVSGKVDILALGIGFIGLATEGKAKFEYSRDGTSYTLIGWDNDGADDFSIDWETAGLEPGDYTIRVTISDSRRRSASAEVAVQLSD
ncbi:MAG: hypothetical protein ACE5LQ_03680 [Candidatus Bipolaricaulia bacterium]